MTTEKILEAVATFEMARSVSKDVAGMEQFLVFYVQKLSAPEKALLARYEKIKTKAWAKAAQDMEVER